MVYKLLPQQSLHLVPNLTITRRHMGPSGQRVTLYVEHANETAAFGGGGVPNTQTSAAEDTVVWSEYKATIYWLLPPPPNRLKRTSSGIRNRTYSVCAPIRKECEMNFPLSGIRRIADGCRGHLSPSPTNQGVMVSPVQLVCNMRVAIGLPVCFYRYTAAQSSNIL